ncbi:hypothetical protein TrLO_g5526 [Triparma laevis f. longispina]|uniref:Uncharacterized protein n=1 Tax=Triparma laevis f. longispina TaxID=1714387 RepID=A0A9W6ZVH8_9STRA|nr:hypothetical protein TrLO_g5526 [Triparma laevis f. longispina]
MKFPTLSALVSFTALAATASACTVGYPDPNYGHCSMDSDCCQPATCFRDEREGYVCVQKKQAAVKGLRGSVEQ